MEINKIRTKYCTNEKVQIMLSNASRQIILSRDGYTYLREGDLTVHSYLSDPVRGNMPFKHFPSSRKHATHLFKYEQPYVKFTEYRDMNKTSNSERFLDEFKLTFLYFIRLRSNDALCIEFGINDIKEEEKIVLNFTEKELMAWLYDINNLNSKCIFSKNKGIEFAYHKNEIEKLDKAHLDLSDEAIIKCFNSRLNPLFFFYGEEKHEDITDINIIPEFKMTNNRSLFCDKEWLVTIDNDDIYIYDFDIVFCKKGQYRVEAIKKKVSIDHNNIIKTIKNEKIIDYCPEPDFLKGSSISTVKV